MNFKKKKKVYFHVLKAFWNNVEERELTTYTAEILIFSHFFHIPLGSAIFHNLHGIICHQDWNHFWWDWEDERWKKGKLCLVTCLSSCDSDTMERATNDPCVILLLSLQPWWCRCHHRLRRQSQWNENGKKKISITDGYTTGEFKISYVDKHVFFILCNYIFAQMCFRLTHKTETSTKWEISIYLPTKVLM